MIVKLALRSLLRNRWRSGLTLAGIAVATAMLTWTVGLIDGMSHQMIRVATAVETGQVQLHSAEYADSATIYHHFPDDPAMFEQILAEPQVSAAAGRVHVFGLIGHEARSRATRIIGVDPRAEADVSLLDDGITEGSWLSDRITEYPEPREVVLGEGLADQLEVSIGDELVLFVQGADGSLGNDLLTVTGIIRSGNAVVDRATAVMHIEDVQYLAALDGRLHEIALRVDNYSSAPQVAENVAALIGGQTELVLDDNGDPAPDTMVVEAWQTLLPAMSTMLELNDKSIGVMFFIIYLIVALGILNTQRMSALERRREFGVLLAIGLSRGRLALVVLVETVVLTLLGSSIGALMGLGLSAYHAKHGINLAALSDKGDSFSFMGVSFSERMYTVVSAESALLPIVVTFFVALLCGLWPALSSARLNATQAISGRT